MIQKPTFDSRSVYHKVIALHENPGNVYYSMAEGKISNVQDRNNWNQNLVFPFFLDWLIFYLEGIEG